MPNLFRNRNLLVDLFVILFGISGWLGITAVFLQLPLIVDKAPEGWKLPSYIAILVQFGNVANFIYILYEKYSPVKVKDGHMIYAMLISGCVASFGLIFLYQQTADIGGAAHSIWLFVFSGVYATIGCLSSVISMPYMGKFKEIYLATYFFGQGLNSFLSSVVSLIQGSGNVQQNCSNTQNDSTTIATTADDVTNAGPIFDPSIFFLFVFVMMVISTIAFALLQNMKQCRRERASSTIYATMANGSEGGSFYKGSHGDMYEVIASQQPRCSKFLYGYLMLLLCAISCMGYGVLPGLAAYSCGPYGVTAYHLSVTLSALTNPIACISAMFWPHISLRNLFAQSTAITGMVGYLLYTAITSPSPPFVGTLFGTVLIVSSPMITKLK